MIIFLYGQDDYRRTERKKWYIAEFEKKYSGLSVGFFDLAEPEAHDNLRLFLRGESLFEEKKLAVLENVYETEEKTVIDGLKAVAKSKNATALISEQKKPPKKLEFLISEAWKTEEFENLAGEELYLFIKKAAQQFGIVLENGALDFLAEIYKNNSWALVTEIEKLSNLDKKRIFKEDLEALGLETLPNYWMVMNSLKSQNPAARFWALEKLFAQNEPPAKIFNILSSLWREKIPQMAEYDFMVKSGKLDYDEVLVELVLSQ